MQRPPKYKQVQMPSDPDIQTRVEVMSKNLRRDLLDFQEFQQLVEVIDLKELSLRWLISISDSYLTRGTEKERAISGIISTFATIGARTIDTVTLNLPLENLQEHHQHLYDGMVSVNLNSCDTYQNYFERIDSVIRLEPFLYKLWREIKGRIQHNSKVFKKLDELHERGIYKLPPYSQWKGKHYEQL